jgi:hypothetical protein
MSVKYAFPSTLHLSKECLDLISRIFVGNPTQRITMPEILAHPWFLKNMPEELKASACCVFAVLASLAAALYFRPPFGPGTAAVGEGCLPSHLL